MNDIKELPQIEIEEEWANKEHILDPDRILIRLSYEAPVAIEPTKWPLIVELEEWVDGSSKVRLRVRQRRHETLIYGVRVSSLGPTQYSGILHNSRKDKSTLALAIAHSFAGEAAPFEMRQRLIQKLPPTLK